MFIYDGNKAWVTQRLLELQSDPRVASTCREVGAKLDGTDSVLTLCAVDDQLALTLGPEQSPLKAPASAPLVKAPRAPSRASHLLKLKMQQKTVRRGGVALSPAEVEHRFKGLQSDKESDLKLFRSVVRLRDARRDEVERAVPSMGRLELLARAAAITNRQREDFRRRVDKLKRTDDRVEALKRIGEEVHALFAALDDRDAPTFGLLCFNGVSEYFEFSAGTNKVIEEVAATAEKLRPWLAAEADLALKNPVRLRLRTAESAALCGDDPSFANHGPSSLLDALDRWFRDHGDAEFLRQDEAFADALVHKAASAVVDHIEAGLAWLTESVGSRVTASEAKSARFALECLFHNCVSFDGGVPSYSLVLGLLVDGAFDEKWKRPRRAKGSLASTVKKKRAGRVSRAAKGRLS